MSLRVLNKSPRAPLKVPSIFFSKRFIFSFVAVVVWVNFSWGQITLMIIVQLLHVCWLVSVNPFENVWLNRLEITNEIVALYSMYWLYIFSGITPPPKVRYRAAKFLTSCLYFMVSLNLAITLYMTYLDCRRNYDLNQKLQDKKCQKELDKLNGMQVTCYGIQCGNNDYASHFYDAIAAKTAGLKLKLSKFDSMPAIFIGICLKQVDPLGELLKEYESKLEQTGQMTGEKKKALHSLGKQAIIGAALTAGGVFTKVVLDA